MFERVVGFFPSKHKSRFEKAFGMKDLQNLTVLFLAFSIVLTGLPQALHLQLSAYGAPSDLMVFAEAPSFARLVDVGFQDPSGWFFHAVLYNPTNSSIVVTGLRWSYTGGAGSQLIDQMRPPFGAKCFDTRYFTYLPTPFLSGQSTIVWEYASGSISISVPPRKILLTWIEAPTKSRDNSLALPATYSVQAYAGNQWISSPLYSSHGGSVHAVSTLFRADFNLTTDPRNESQVHPNPKWLFQEDRSIVAYENTRVRLIPVVSGEGTGISTADINVTLPLSWSFVPGSVRNPLGENATISYSSNRYHLRWTINHKILTYSTDQSLSQDYIEFNVTAPRTPTISGLGVNARITSIDGQITTENQSIYTVIETAPTADFTIFPSTVEVNQTATFNASLSNDLDGNIVKYSWDFGDGNTASGAIVNHAYSIRGNHTVSLTVTDNDGLTDTKTASILVIQRPKAYFTFTPTYPVVGELVDFDASTSAPNGGSITSYSWDFGNGHRGSGQTTGTIYTAPGEYFVVLNVTNDVGLWDTQTRTVKVREAPSAYFTYSPSLPLVNQPILFNASLSNPNSGNITGFYWNFGDGSNGTGSVLIHSYSSFGNYSVNLLVTNSEGLNNSLAQSIRVLCKPISNFTWTPIQIRAPEIVTFDASPSYDPDGSIMSYRWDFGDGNVTNSNNLFVNHVYGTFGTYLLNLTVIDNDGLCDSSQVYVTVVEAPTASFTVYPLNPKISQNITFDATSSVPNGGTIVQYKWNFADSATDEGVVVQHVFATAGIYNVTLTVLDSEGLNATANQNVNVNANPISVFVYSPAKPLTDQIVTFDASLSIPISGTITEYFWKFGDNSTSTGELTNHAYRANGNYTVTLTVINSLGFNDTVTSVILVDALPVANFTVLPNNPSTGLPVVFNATNSYDIDGTISRFRWNFGDGNTTEASEKTIRHVYASAGNCTVTLTVFDNDNHNSSTSEVLTIYSHNVAVLSVDLSSTQVNRGKLVNVTVTVENTGTANETFNVTAYYNSSVLATQTVDSLLPNTQKTLLFIWNTSDLLEGKSYAVRAVAGNVIGETNTMDNILSGSNLSVTGGTAGPFGFLGSTSFLLPIGLVLGGILALGAALLFFRRKPAETVTDEPETPSADPLDALVGGELPDGFSVMILGEANSGKSILCQQLTNKYLNQGKPCIYITYDCFPNEIRDNMRTLGWDPAIFEQGGKLAIVDAYSSTAAVTCNEKHWIKQPFSLSELGIAISTAVSAVEPKPRVFLDSTVPLFTRLEPATVVEFLQDRAAQIKGVSGIFFFAVGKGTLQTDHLSRLEELVDCVIELDLFDKEVDITRQIRIKKLRGRKFEDRKLEFHVVDQKGIVTSQETLKKDKD